MIDRIFDAGFLTFAIMAAVDGARNYGSPTLSEAFSALVAVVAFYIFLTRIDKRSSPQKESR